MNQVNFSEAEILAVLNKCAKALEYDPEKEARKAAKRAAKRAQLEADFQECIKFCQRVRVIAR